MKDVIQNELAMVLGWLTHFPDSDEKRDLRGIVLEAFNAVSVEVDFMIARLEGDAGIIDQASRKLPNVASMLQQNAVLLRNYAARLKDSNVVMSNLGGPDQKGGRIILLPGNDGS